MDNLLIIFISTMALYFMFIIIDKIMMRISYRFNKKEFLLKYPTIKNVVKFLVGYIAIILLFILTILQNKFHFIRIPSNCDPIVLVVAIFTMYGIFISSIQFLINYSSTNTRDLYWGKSKTKLILMDSTEYKIFNSTIFRILLIYICIYSILDLAKLNFLYKYSITDYADSFFNISIFLIMIEFIFFFIKSMAISSILFFVQEDRERINYQIKNKLLNEYKFLFNESIKFYKFDFIDIIFSELHNVDKSQREEMVYSILCHVYGWHNWDWEVHSNEVLNFIDKIFKRTKKQRIYDNVFTLKMLNENFWNQYEQSDLKFLFNKLLDIYIRQENLIYNFIGKKSNSTKEMFSSIFEEVYEEKNTVLKEISCFNFPQIIWDSISSIEDIIKLSKAVRSLQIMKILYHSIESDDCCFIESLWKKIIEVYCTFIIEVLEKGKAFEPQMDDKAIEFILNINSRRKRKYNEGQLKPKDISTDYICFREKIHESLKGYLLYYLFSLENSPLNQNHILKICSFLEIKYIMAFICYRILYTGSDSSKWKGEILFFKKLISSKYYYDNVFEEQNIEFVADEIANSNIGHRISTELIKWIFNNINAQVSENLLKECTERRYLSYAIFITFNFIFGQDIFMIGYKKIVS